MANCEDYLELISAKLDGELTAEEEARLAAHLEQCPQCRALLEELGGLSDALRTLPEAEPPVGLTEQVMSLLQDEGASVPSSSGVSRGTRRPSGKAIQAVAAMAAVAVIATVAVFRTNLTAPIVRDDGQPSPAVEPKDCVTASADGGDGVATYSGNSGGNSEALPDASEPVSYGGWSATEATARIGGVEVTAADGTVPPSIAPYNDTQKGALSPEKINTTALLYCYGLAELPTLPNYLSELLYCDGADYFFPAEQLPALRNVLEVAGPTTELEPQETYTGEADEWVQIVFIP